MAGLCKDAVVPDEVRVARPEEYPLITEIESAADGLFAAHGVRVPDGRTPVAVLAAAAAVLVTGDPPVGSAWLEIVDGLAHLEQLSVHPSAMRHGRGTALLLASIDWAAAHGYPAITLTTFRDLAFNGPFYARHGFVPMTELSAGLAALRENERALGLDRQGVRIAMRREVRS
jgi:GNAT superfamily N-acetyltransferase